MSYFNAFRFNHPDFDIGTRPGFAVSPNGGVEMISGAASIRQSLLLLLSTSKGERVMRPNYGCDLNRLMFNPNDDTTAGLAIHYARQAIDRWEPRIEIIALDAGRDPQRPGQLNIRLDYFARPTLTRDQLIYPLELIHPEL